MKKSVNVVCIKWGPAYDAEYINILYRMIKRNTSYGVNFYCFTDETEGLDSEIKIFDLPVLDTLKEYQTIHAYRKEAGLCDDNLAGLKNQRVFFFDLDIVIIDNLDELFDYPESDRFYIIKDWNSRNENVGQASCYSWVVGTLGHVKKYFEEHPKEVVDKYFTASQEFLSDKVIEKYGQLNFWPERWFASFRFHCLPKFGPLRHFIAPTIPKWRGLKVIVFHGMPNPREASKGIWPLKSGHKWKKLYKTCKPATWVNRYWY